MHKLSYFFCAALFGLLLTANPQNVAAGNRIVIYDDIATEVVAPPSTLAGV